MGWSESFGVSSTVVRILAWDVGAKFAKPHISYSNRAGSLDRSNLRQKRLGNLPSQRFAARVFSKTGWNIEPLHGVGGCHLHDLIREVADRPLW